MKPKTKPDTTQQKPTKQETQKKIQGIQPNTLTGETLVHLRGNPSAPQGEKKKHFLTPTNPAAIGPSP